MRHLTVKEAVAAGYKTRPGSPPVATKDSPPQAVPCLSGMEEGLLGLLAMYLEHVPAFRSKPTGAPHSPMRMQQEQHILLEDTVKTFFAKLERPLCGS